MNGCIHTTPYDGYTYDYGCSFDGNIYVRYYHSTDCSASSIVSSAMISTPQCHNRMESYPYPEMVSQAEQHCSSDEKFPWDFSLMVALPETKLLKYW